jgi:hypothetical protein
MGDNKQTSVETISSCETRCSDVPFFSIFELTIKLIFDIIARHKRVSMGGRRRTNNGIFYEPVTPRSLSGERRLITPWLNGLQKHSSYYLLLLELHQSSSRSLLLFDA